MKIAFFGTGLMGSGFVRRLLANGHAVNVWNRSPAKALALVALGAVAFGDPATARRGGVELCVMPGVAALFDAAIARGEGALDSAAAARMPI